MPQLIPEALPLRDAARNRIRQRHADQKRKSRLDRIVQRTSNPFRVRLVETQQTPEPVPRKRFRHFRKPQHFRHHQQHHQSAIGIDGNITRSGRRARRSHTSACVFHHHRYLDRRHTIHNAAHIADPLRSFHCPCVKSGNFCGALPCATDASLNPPIALQAAASYTSISGASPPRMHSTSRNNIK